MLQIDPCNAENSLKDMARQQDKFLRTANSFHVKGNDKYARSVQCIVFMITRILLIRKWLQMNFHWDQWILIRRIWECHLRCGRSEDLCRWVKWLNTLNYMELIFQTMKMQNPWWSCLLIYLRSHHSRRIEDTWRIIQILWRWMLRG